MSEQMVQRRIEAYGNTAVFNLTLSGIAPENSEYPDQRLALRIRQSWGTGEFNLSEHDARELARALLYAVGDRDAD